MEKDGKGVIDGGREMETDRWVDEGKGDREKEKINYARRTSSIHSLSARHVPDMYLIMRYV